MLRIGIFALIAVASLVVGSPASATTCYDYDRYVRSQNMPPVTIAGEVGVFVSTYTRSVEGRESAERVARAWCGATVRSYGVEVLRINPATREVLEWRRYDGWSVWIGGSGS